MADSVEIFTDGACSGNPGPGGWGVVMRWRGHEKELLGGEKETTNNRMELMAAIMGIEALEPDSPADIYTDSKYVKDGITKWIVKWKENGWKTAVKKPVKNEDLWRRLDASLMGHDVDWHWIEAHTGHPENERADALARRGIEEAG